MNSAEQMYAVGLNDIVDTLMDTGTDVTYLIQGHMGTGKSELLKMLIKKLAATHLGCYCDCTTKDLGDITIPNIAKMDDGTGYVTYLTNEELGMHINKPIVLMLDEYGKANKAVKNALLRVILERKIGSYELHPDSIVFATTNLGAENVGDKLEPHQRNRVSTLLARKPTAEEWLVDFAIPNGLNPSVMGFAKEYPHIFQGFEEVKDPSDNPYIFHPREERAAFITPRSLHTASKILTKGVNMSEHALHAALIGAIGARGALDLMAFVTMANQLPSIESIKQDPAGAKVPDGASAVCMTVFKVLGAMERELVNPWMDYMGRLSKEAQAMFVQGAMNPDYKFHTEIVRNGKFGQWAIENNYMFTADKK